VSYCVGCTTCEIAPNCPRASRASLIGRDAQRWLGYIGTVLFMLGALAVSASPAWSGHPAPFAVFLIGHVVWALLGYLLHERSLLAMNALYIVFDAWAVAVRLPLN
jgi:hypothetical protein